MSENTQQLAEHKLIILHLVQKMGIPLANSEICQFLLEKNYMDYFAVQEYLAELVEAGWLDMTKEQNNTRYSLTGEGEEVLMLFMNRISEKAKKEIYIYAQENQSRIRAEYAVTANYFPEVNNDYLVKCGLCDQNGSTLMEVSVMVANKEQAQLISQNWKKHIASLYGKIMFSLVSPDDEQFPLEYFLAKEECFPKEEAEKSEDA